MKLLWRYLAYLLEENHMSCAKKSAIPTFRSMILSVTMYTITQFFSKLHVIFDFKTKESLTLNVIFWTHHIMSEMNEITQRLRERPACWEDQRYLLFGHVTNFHSHVTNFHSHVTWSRGRSSLWLLRSFFWSFKLAKPNHCARCLIKEATAVRKIL